MDAHAAMAFVTTPFIFLCAFGIGYAALWWCVRAATDDRRLRQLIVLSYGLRAVLAVALFVISYWQWPIFRSLQLPGGFWKFGSDAPVYDQIARSALDMWAAGIVPWSLDVGIDYFLIVAAVYKLLGRCLLYPVLFNCWLAALNGLLAYLIGRQLVSPRAAFRAAVMVSVWPSSFLWSAQLMAEPLTWLLVSAALVLILSVASEDRTASRRFGGLRYGWRYMVLGGVVVLLTGLRSYLSAMLLMAVLTVLGPVSGYALLRRQFGRALRLAGIMVVIAASISCARSLDLYKLFSPHQPEQGDYVRGIQDWKRGDLERAEAVFREAIRVHQRHQEAYMALGALKVQTGQYEDALQAYFQYLPAIHPEDVGTRARVNQIIANIYQLIGDQRFEEERVEEAIVAVALAVRFDPSLSFMRADLKLRLPPQPSATRIVRSDQERTRLAEEYVAIKTRAAHDALLSAEAAVPPASAPIAPLALVEEQQEVAEAPQARAVRGRMAKAVAAPPAPRSQRVTTPDASASAPIAPSSLEREQSEQVVLAMALAQVPSMRPTAPPEIAKALKANPASAPTAAMETPPTAPRRPAALHRLEPIAQIVWNMRLGFLSGGGGSVIDPDRDLSSAQELLAYLPRALAIGFLAPFPWQWFEAGASVGGMRVVAGVEMVLMYLLMPSLLWGIWLVATRRRYPHIFFLTFIVSTAVAMSIVVANVGTLFRLRLLYFLPLLVVIAEGDPRGGYRRLAQWWTRVAARERRHDVAEEGREVEVQGNVVMRSR